LNDIDQKKVFSHRYKLRFGIPGLAFVISSILATLANPDRSAKILFAIVIFAPNRPGFGTIRLITPESDKMAQYGGTWSWTLYSNEIALAHWGDISV